MADILIVGTETNAQVTADPGPVWRDKLNGYWLTSNGADFVRLYKTEDGGETWALLATIDTTNGSLLRYSLWDEDWTPGDGGTKIHITWQGETTPGTTRDGLWYAGFDTATETMSNKQRILEFSGETSGFFRTIGITKARGGYLFIAVASSGGTYFYRSIDGGVNWVAKDNSFMENTTDFWLLRPGNEANSQDIWVPYADVSNNEISLKVYDDFDDSWSETSVDSSGNTFTGGEVMSIMRASIRHSDGHMILAFWTQQFNAAADLKVYDINGAASIVQKTNVETNYINLGLGMTIDQNTDIIYITYGDASVSSNLVDILYKKSIDDALSWGASTQINVTARRFHDSVSAVSVGANGGRFLVVFYDQLNSDAYTNFDNAFDLEIFPTYRIIDYTITIAPRTDLSSGFDALITFNLVEQYALLNPDAYAITRLPDADSGKRKVIT